MALMLRNIVKAGLVSERNEAPSNINFKNVHLLLLGHQNELEKTFIFEVFVGDSFYGFGRQTIHELVVFCNFR